MKELFKQLIVDFHQAQLPKPSLRTFDLPKQPRNVRKAYVLIGMRRSGKTWALYQRMHELIQTGIDLKQILYINFADDRLLNLNGNDLKFILDAYFELHPEYLNNPSIHFFFDEIHEVPNWEHFICRLLDKEKMTIYVSGSSAKMLSKEIASLLRGRVIEREIFPFDFYEYLIYYNIKPKFPLASKQKNIVSFHLKNFLERGGFPEAAALFDHTVLPMKFPIALSKTNLLLNELCELLQSYVESVVYRDIIERYKIKNIHVVKKLLINALKNSANLFSINKIYRDLKSQGYSVGKDSLYEFMNYFEDAYCMFSVPIYHFSAKQSADLAPKKIYPIDQGFITAYTIKDSFEQAARLETAVFSHLRRHCKDIYYYRTQSGKEVDFVTVSPKGQLSLYQATYSLEDKITMQRESGALQSAMAELKIRSGTIINMDKEEKIKTPQGIINCVPLYKFFLMYEVF